MWNLIMVGGISDIGKSLLTNQLIKIQPNLFVRPVSYTTRKQRDNSDNEYNYVDNITFDSLKDTFLTIDTIYNNRYAISKLSIQNLIENNIIPIKEIHSDNHNKIKKILPNVLSIILLPKNINDFYTQNITSKRIIEDMEYYRLNKDSFYNYPFDLTYIIDESRDIIPQIEEIALKVLDKINNFKNDTKISDNINRANYNLISTEFTEEKRVTTKNFHDISEKAFLHSFSKYINDNLNILEIGCGQGYLTNLLNNYIKENDIKYNKYTCIDISDEMLSIASKRFTNSNIEFLNIPVSNIDLLTEKYDIVISSLSDPFLTIDSLLNIYKILKPNGIFISNTPTKEWSNNIHNNNLITFVSEIFESVKVVSNVYTNSEIKELFKQTNFKIIEFNNLYNILKDNISTDIKDYKNIPLLYFFIIRKD